METFFSTVQSNAVHVTWGAPPPVQERTREWALLHRLITQPDYAGRAHIYLHNLANGMDSNGAIRSLSEDPAKFNAEVDRYFAAGVFSSTQAPNRPLNPERDFNTTILTSDEGQLMRADMLTPGSAEIYQTLLKAGKHVAEDHEGLAILAMRAGDTQQARNHMEAAREAGTHNVVALTAYGSLEKDPETGRGHSERSAYSGPEVRTGALGSGREDRRSSPPHDGVETGGRSGAAQLRLVGAVRETLRGPEAVRGSRAGVAGRRAGGPGRSRAASRRLTARGQIDQLRLDDEYEIRRKEAAAKAAEIDRLKSQARKEIADMEARVNTRPLSKEEAAKTVDWADVNPLGDSLKGTLVRVDCAGKQLTLSVRDGAGRVQRLLVSDPAHVEIKGGDGTFHCGVQKARPVTVLYNPAGLDKKTVLGEVTGIEFR